MNVPINYFAVLVAAISNMVIGMLWYGPLFGKIWRKEMKFDAMRMEGMKNQGGMGGLYFTAFVTSFLMAYVLAHFAGLFGVDGISGAFQLAFWTWLGFYVTSVISQVLWEGKSKTLYAVNVGYYLVVLVVASCILTVWH